jgi:hypothetical protein
MKTPHFTVIKINWLMLFKEIIAVYTENHTKPIKKGTITECKSRRYIWFPLGFKGLIHREIGILLNNILRLF